MNAAGTGAEAVVAQLKRLGIVIAGVDIDEDSLSGLYEEAEASNEVAIGHLLRDGLVTEPLATLPKKLIIDRVVDATPLGGRSREMLFGIARFEGANATDSTLARLVHPTMRTARRIGARLFVDEANGSVILTKTNFEGTEKVADSLVDFLAACKPAMESMPVADDFPSDV